MKPPRPSRVKTKKPRRPSHVIRNKKPPRPSRPSQEAPRRPTRSPGSWPSPPVDWCTPPSPRALLRALEVATARAAGAGARRHQHTAITNLFFFFSKCCTGNNPRMAQAHLLKLRSLRTIARRRVGSNTAVAHAGQRRLRTLFANPWAGYPGFSSAAPQTGLATPPQAPPGPSTPRLRGPSCRRQRRVGHSENCERPGILEKTKTSGTTFMGWQDPGLQPQGGIGPLGPGVPPLRQGAKKPDRPQTRPAPQGNLYLYIYIYLFIYIY